VRFRMRTASTLQPRPGLRSHPIRRLTHKRLMSATCDQFRQPELPQKADEHVGVSLTAHSAPTLNDVDRDFPDLWRTN
jgi:hypothetical protein